MRPREILSRSRALWEQHCLSGNDVFLQTCTVMAFAWLLVPLALYDAISNLSPEDSRTDNQLRGPDLCWTENRTNAVSAAHAKVKGGRKEDLFVRCFD